MENDSVAQAFEFDFEKNFNHKDAKGWMTEHWTDTGYYVVFYLLIIFGLENLMKNRPVLKLERVLIVWNILLAIFSIIGAYRTVPEFFDVLTNDGFYESVCNSSFVTTNKLTGTWAFLFTLSKLSELIDTVFIVLRKRPLTFLHVYHHCLALVYTWFSYKDSAALFRWFGTMNLFVHSLMYSYYALCMMKYKPPRAIAMTITILQIMQMIIGFTLSVITSMYRSRYDCQNTPESLAISVIAYGSFVYLFIRFFINAYISDKPTKKSMKIPAKDQ